MRYLFENGCKEGLVAHPSLWEGLHVVEALTKGTPFEGLRVDRTAMYQAKKRVGLVVEEKDFTSKVELMLDVLPIWEDLSLEERQARAIALVEEAALSFPAPRGGRPLRAPVRLRSPHYRPKRLKRGYAPLCHSSTREHRDAFREAYEVFVSAYRAAVEMLRNVSPSLASRPTPR